ncbi:MAG: hypothetical protein O3B19_09355 [Actinomycetota bacterium]|nr:hypothetical protein [Actinomycetota bacterium]
MKMPPSRWSEMNKYSERLLRTMESTANTWLRSSFDRVVADQGLHDQVDAGRREAAIEAARSWLVSELGRLLEAEAWEQRRNPLDLVRECTGRVSDELAAIGARPVARDEFQERSFPADVFDLCPATWADVHPDLHDVGLEWGAWKAAAIISHRRTTAEQSEIS